MSANNTHRQGSGKELPCKAAREKMTPALDELARLRKHLPLSHEAFAAELQRIVDEHAQPCGCDLVVQHAADGPIKVHIKAQKLETQCEVCTLLECFFHHRTD